MEDLILLGLAHYIASYLFMCCLTNKILGFQIESKKPGKGSASMEPVAVKKVLEVMIQDGTRIGMFVSDRCSNIGKVTRAVEEKYMINIKVILICGTPISMDYSGEDYALTVQQIDALVDKLKSANSDLKQLTVQIKTGTFQQLFFFSNCKIQRFIFYMN